LRLEKELNECRAEVHKLKGALIGAKAQSERAEEDARSARKHMEHERDNAREQMQRERAWCDKTVQDVLNRCCRIDAQPAGDAGVMSSTGSTSEAANRFKDARHHATQGNQHMLNDAVPMKEDKNVTGNGSQGSGRANISEVLRPRIEKVDPQMKAKELLSIHFAKEFSSLAEAIGFVKGSGPLFDTSAKDMYAQFRYHLHQHVYNKSDLIWYLKQISVAGNMGKHVSLGALPSWRLASARMVCGPAHRRLETAAVFAQALVLHPPGVQKWPLGGLQPPVLHPPGLQRLVLQCRFNAG
jgi:hypothetical protein